MTRVASTPVYYYRPSPHRTRIVFGVRVSLEATDSRVSGPRLLRDLVALFPELAGTRISHSWVGFVAYTFNPLAHLGQHDGVHHTMGYCGSGVSMASYLDMRVGQQVLGLPEGRTAFDGLRFETRPLYSRSPWFLALSVMYYRWRDRWKGDGGQEAEATALLGDLISLTEQGARQLAQLRGGGRHAECGFDVSPRFLELS